MVPIATIRQGRRYGGVMALGVLVTAVSATAQPVADAARAADWDTVRTLIAGHADVTAGQGDGATALHWAGYWDDTAIASLLLDAGADASAANDLGATPLWTAAENGSEAMTDLLLAAGADPTAALLSGETVLMTAARTGNVAVVRALLGSGADVDATEHGRHQNALMWAIGQRHAGVVEALLEHQPDLRARSDVRTEVVKTTPEPWNPDYIVDLPQGGYTPLLFAARVGDLASARLLVSAGADVNDTAPYGTSATVVAAHSGHGGLAAFLVEAGADPNRADAGYAALHAAILHKDDALARVLLTHGADPNAVVETSTPVRRDSVDYYFHPSYVGATPFWLAARFNAPAIMQALVDHGADATVSHHPIYWEGSLAVRDDRAQRHEGETTAIMAAAGLGGRAPLFAVDRLDRIAESAPVRSTRREPDPRRVEAATLDAVRIGIERGVDVNVANATGQTALHAVAGNGFDSVVAYLVDHGARLDLRNIDNQTPLDFARARGVGESTVSLLKSLGAEE
ncbi:MAG: ankyrin repeat domain-containing protein [Acidobacteriota bacterium]|nr:ankyrin repeat domain-containing protein [Acidobacteriota bacterium]